MKKTFNNWRIKKPKSENEILIDRVNSLRKLIKQNYGIPITELGAVEVEKWFRKVIELVVTEEDFIIIPERYIIK